MPFCVLNVLRTTWRGWLLFVWFGEFKDNIDRNHGTSRNQGANRTHQVLKQSVAQSNATSNVFRHAPFGWFVLGSIL